MKNLIGLDEQSATGIGGNLGVLVSTVPTQSQAETDGFRPLDVILSLGSASVVSLEDLNRLYGAATPGQPLSVGIHRNQQDSILSIAR